VVQDGAEVSVVTGIVSRTFPGARSSPLHLQAERRNDHAPGDRMCSTAKASHASSREGALVTGGSEGIGGAIVQRLSDAERRSSPRAARTAKRRRPAVFVTADLSSVAGVHRVVSKPRSASVVWTSS